MINNFPILIVTGVGRSGTSLLQAMLDAHSEIDFIKESHFIYNYLLPIYLKGDADFPIDANMLEKLLNDQYISRLSIDVEELIKTLEKKDLLHFYYQMHVASNDKQTYYGDKDPALVGLIPEVLSLFENAKVIHIIRDPRDVILSRTKTQWGKKYPLWVHVLEYKYGIKATRTKKKYDQSRYLEIRYEDLLKNPENSLKDICSKLDIPFESQMLEYNLTAEKLISDSEKEWKQNVSKSIMKSNVNKWKNAFNSWQLIYIESILDRELRELSYHRSSPKNLVSKIIQFCGQFISFAYASWKYIKHRNR